MIRLSKKSCLNWGLAFILSAHASYAETVGIYYDSSIPQIAFAAGDIKAALEKRDLDVATHALGDFDSAAGGKRIVLSVLDHPGISKTFKSAGAKPVGDLSPQSYAIRTTDAPSPIFWVLGGDANGAMYGGLQIAESITLNGFPSNLNEDGDPHIKNRGIKFNIPLDVRTPSYSDNSDAAQLNIPEMWEKDFWTGFFDSMARYRYNVVSLWSLHPFPSMVKVPEFPEVALNDVWRTKEKLDDSFHLWGTDMVRPEMLANHEVVKQMTMEEKIVFWRWVMQQAADRGIKMYVFTWNVFTWGAEGKHGITCDMANEATKKYFRASVREMVKTYPLLAGLGITAGENMPHEMSSKDKEKWLWETYGEGVRDGLKDDPKRNFRMIHRFHWSAQSDILDAFKDYPSDFDFSFKYSVAHMYSVPNPQFIKPLLENIAPKMKTWLTVRNDDIYSFRFGDPAYAREYITNMPKEEIMGGFYMGPDGYILGRDFLDRKPEPGKRPLVIDKQWYSFAQYGRLAYDPTLPDSHFEKMLAERHPKASSKDLFVALQSATQVMPLITRFFWKSIDCDWFPEACISHPTKSGFYTIKHFMEGSSMPDADVLCIRDWRKLLLEGKPKEQTTPLEIAVSLESAALRIEASLGNLRSSANDDSELRKTILDLEAFAALGNYYAAKIRGSCALALFDHTADTFDHDRAIDYLDQALAHWKQYATVRDGQYLPALYNRLGVVDITALTAKVAEDIEIARNWKPGTLKDDGKRGGSERGFRH
jgi:hypothetical protein